MFLGHFALGFAAKKIDPRPSVGTTMMAAQFIDLIWPLFLILGWEKVNIEPGNTAVTPLNFTHYPWSHSLAAVLLWALLTGTIYFIISKNRKGAIILALLVASHWLMDLITHRPDLPLDFSGNSKVGLGLWNVPVLTILVEGSLFICGTWIYMKNTKAINKKGNILTWGFILVLSAIYIMNIAGPPPPDEKAIGYAGLLQWLFIGWAYWMDNNRKTV